ncbi:MAG TPA: FG-GAP-like repeat-containing protein, partial [Polyangiaceae bacterium]
MKLGLLFTASFVTVAIGTVVACSGNDDANTIVVPPAPISLSSVSPSTISARGGEIVKLTGSGFAADTKVKLGDQDATQVKLVSANELDVTAPPLWAGSIDVQTSGPGGTSQLQNAVQVTALDLRFVQAPTYSLTIGNDVDAGADAGSDAGPNAPSPPISTAVTADFDGNGSIDMVSCAQNEECHLLVNDGQGNYQDTTATGDKRFGVGSTDTHVLALGDFDGDGDQDLVVAGASAIPMIETNDGKGHFTETPLSWIEYGDGGVAETLADGGAAPLDPVSAFGVGDVDGDGKVDLVVGNTTADEIPFRILRNTSSGKSISFAESSPDAVPARAWPVTAIQVADVDRDGAQDIVVATPGAADGVELRLLLGSKGVFNEAHSG